MKREIRLLRRSIRRTFKIANALFFFLIIFYVSYNFYYGWNRVALTNAEIICDLITKTGFFAWLFLHFYAIIDYVKYKLIKDEIKEYEEF